MSDPRDMNLGYLLNAILVYNNIRPAMLIQNADYGEMGCSGKNTSKIAKYIIKAFGKRDSELKKRDSELKKRDLELKEHDVDLKERDVDLEGLKASANYKINQGIIISRTSYDGNMNISLNDMGHILGYPCANDFGCIDNNNIHYGLFIYAIEVDENSPTRFKKLQIFANVCKNDSNYEVLKKMINSRSDIFMTKASKDILDDAFKEGIIKNTNIHHMICTSLEIMPPRILIKRLTNPDYELSESNKLIINYSLDSAKITRGDLYEYFTNNDKIKNPIIRGMLIYLLLTYVNDVNEPVDILIFQEYNDKYQEMLKIGRKLENALINTINSIDSESKMVPYYRDI